MPAQHQPKRLRRHWLALLVYVCVIWIREPALPAAEADWHSKFLQALHIMEANGASHPADGDGGRAIGPFQIHLRYWKDAVRNQPHLRQQGYQKCRDYAYARQIVIVYLKQYADDAWNKRDGMTLARIHNGGPEGAAKRETKEYGQQVYVIMQTLIRTGN